MELIKRMKKVQEKTEALLKRILKKERRSQLKKQRKTKIQKKRDKIILSMKDLVFKEQLAKKLIEKYMKSYIIT